MQYINKIEIKGRIGMVRSQEIHGKKVANFSVVTEFLCKLPDGTMCSEATWHQTVAWEGKSIDPKIFSAFKGNAVHIVGRVRQNKYTAADGTDRIFQEIIASEVKLLNEEQSC